MAFSTPLLASRLIGGAGDDWLSGGAGADTLQGGEGTDILTGGGGDDLFQFAPGFGAATITDFEAGVDAIELADFPIDQGDPGYYTSHVGGDAVFHLDSGDVLTLTGLTPEAIIDDLAFV